MSISGLSSTTPYAATLASSNMSQRRADFHALGSALQSGDLAGAQKAFAALWQDTQKSQPGGPAQAQPGQSTNVQAPANALRHAHHGHHHHHHHASAGAVDAGSSAGAATGGGGTSQSVGSTVNVLA